LIKHFQPKAPGKANSPAKKSGDSPAKKSGDSPAKKSGDSPAKKSGDSPAKKSGNAAAPPAKKSPPAKKKEGWLSKATNFIKGAAKKGADAVKNTAKAASDMANKGVKNISNAIKKGAKDVKSALNKGADAAREAIKKGAEAVKEAAKKGAAAVAQIMKDKPKAPVNAADGKIFEFLKDNFDIFKRAIDRLFKSKIVGTITEMINCLKNQNPNESLKQTILGLDKTVKQLKSKDYISIAIDFFCQWEKLKYVVHKFKEAFDPKNLNKQWEIIALAMVKLIEILKI
jgi:hypothetical protein